MTEPDRERLGLFLGTLVVFGVLFTLVSRLTAAPLGILAAGYMFSPLIAGLLVVVSSDIPLARVGYRVGRPAWLALSALVALPLVGLTLALALTVPGIGLDPGAELIPGLPLPAGPLGILAALALAVALGATVNAVFALGEEFGWRGYLLWELAPWGFWRASLAIGALWGLWHAPVILEGYNYPSFPLLGVVVMAAATVAFSPLYTYLVVKAESLLAAALLHGVFNGSAGLVVAFAATDDPVLAELVTSPVGLAGIGAFGLATVVIALCGPPALTRDFAEEAPPGSYPHVSDR